MSQGKSAHSRVVVLGAGPYGLSAAAHLKGKGVEVRIFGQPMAFWADKMPAGMLLRSPRVASNISAPERQTTLDAFETSAGVPPRAPLPIETFVEYGRWFLAALGPSNEFHPNLPRSRRHNSPTAIRVVMLKLSPEGAWRS